MTGASRGTAYHRFMECLDYAKTDTKEEITAQIQELVKMQKLEKAEAESITVSDIWKFLKTDIGKRMKEAFVEGRLFREQPFVISTDASLADKKWKQGEKILVQGIIDAYFVENDVIVLVDYKTDRVGYGGEHTLIERYRTQLSEYAKALEQMLDMPVNETYIYSFALGKTIKMQRTR